MGRVSTTLTVTCNCCGEETSAGTPECEECGRSYFALYMDCLECDGTGEIAIDTGNPQDYESEPCEGCAASGEVPAPFGPYA